MSDDVAPPGTLGLGIAGLQALAAVPRAIPASRAGDVLASLAGKTFASATEVAVLEGERLVASFRSSDSSTRQATPRSASWLSLR